MKAVTVEAFGDATQLRFGSGDDPLPAKGEVVVAITTAGVGFVDIMAREGRYTFPKPGFIPGLEIVGDVIVLGEGVSPDWLNRKVIAFPPRGGGYAERITMSASALIPLPRNILPEQALAIGVNGLVAAFSLDRAQVIAGERVFIRGAGGGIGVIATQLASHLTPEVTATTSSDVRGQRLMALGAKTIWNRLTNPPLALNSFDVIIDTIGGPELPSYIAALRPNGRYVLAGGIDGEPPADFGMELIRRFHGSPSFATLSLNSIPTELLAQRLALLFQALQCNEIVTIVDSIFPLADAVAAHRRLESGEGFGKILLTITSKP